MSATDTHIPINEATVNELSEGTDDLQPIAKSAAGSCYGPRVVLVSPYSGNNLGDAAILDSLIASLRHRISDVQISGITLNCDHFLAHHGTRAFPLCGVDRSFHCMVRPQAGRQDGNPERSPSLLARAKQLAIGLPLLGSAFKWARDCVRNLLAELRHGIRGYRFLRSHDCVIVAGGGQLDDEWGGPWGHPFALWKWAILARAARVPLAFASVGACKITSRWSRIFLRSALRQASYRTYRDSNSQRIAIDLLEQRNNDVVVADLAFGLPKYDPPRDREILELAQDRKVIAVSPMNYARPGMWPRADAAVYSRYLRELAATISALTLRGYFIVVVRSTSSDRTAVEELIELLSQGPLPVSSHDFCVPPIDSWHDIVRVFAQANVVIASRLHSVILSFVTGKPAIALSFDPKVDWAMSDLNHQEFRLDIRTFQAAEVAQALTRLEEDLETSARRIETFNRVARTSLSAQADSLTTLTRKHARTAH